MTSYKPIAHQIEDGLALGGLIFIVLALLVAVVAEFAS